MGSGVAGRTYLCGKPHSIARDRRLGRFKSQSEIRMVGFEKPPDIFHQKEIGEGYMLFSRREFYGQNIQTFGGSDGNMVGTVNLLIGRDSTLFKLFIFYLDVGPYEGAERRRRLSGPMEAAAKICLATPTYKLPIVITNTMNVIGERQHPEKYVPMVIKKVLNGEKVSIHSTPDLQKAGSRFYIHARNAFEAIRFILLNTDETIKVKDPSQGRFNVVGDEELDNLTLAQKIASIIGKDLIYEMVDFHSSRPGHDTRYGLDGAKLKTLGFIYPKSFDETLKNVVNWYLEHKEWL